MFPSKEHVTDIFTKPLPKEAFEYLMEKRPQVWPNQGFLLQLLRYETELINSREILPRE